MSTIPYVQMEDARGLTKEVYEDIVHTYGISEPHGVYRLMGHTPEFLAANWQRSRYLYGTDPDDTTKSLSLLSLRDKHAVTLAISATNTCDYCVRLHGERLEQLGMTCEERGELMMVVEVVNSYDSMVELTRAGDDPVISYVDESDSDVIQTIFQEIHRAYGNRQPEDIYRLIAQRPDYLAACWERIKACFFDEGALGLRTKHMVALGVAAANSCDYAIRIHRQRLKEFYLSNEAMVELLLVIDLACGYNRYVQGLQAGETPTCIGRKPDGGVLRVAAKSSCSRSA